MSVCSLDQAGETLVHRTMTATPEALRKAIAPSRAQIVLAAAWMFPWYGLADCGAEHGIPCVLGHALSRKAIHGGKAKNATSDAHPMAVLLRGGRLPQASVSPAERRATRALRRRRMPLARTRGARLAHGHNTNSPSTLPASGPKIASKAHRDGVAERCADPAGQQSIAVDLALLTSDEAWLRAVARTIVQTAKPHDAQTLSRRHTVPGIGTSLSLVLLYAMHAIARFPRGQDVASSCRLGTGARASAGTRSGTSGANSGHAPLTWAFSKAAVLCFRANPAGQPWLTRLEKTHSKGTAFTSLAHQWARAVSDRLQRQPAFALHIFLQGEGRGAGALHAALDSHGMHVLPHARSGVHHGVAARA